MEDAGCFRGESQLLINVQVVGIFVGFLRVERLSPTVHLDVNRDSRLSNSGDNVRLTDSFYRSVVGLFFHRLALVPEIMVNTSRHSLGSLNLYAVLDFGFWIPGTKESITVLPLMFLALFVSLSAPCCFLPMRR